MACMYKLCDGTQDEVLYELQRCMLHHVITFVRRVCVQPLAYMALHVTLTGMTFAVCKVWWNFYMAHTIFLLAILCISAWNGASYYFEVFAHRYVQTVGLPAKPMKKKQ